MATELPGSIRDRFPILDRAVYTNSCSQGALSNDVRAAYEHYMTDWDEKGAPWELWVEQAEGARARFARLLNATPDEVAVTTSVSAGVNSLLSGLRHTEGRNKIVISDFEFPTIGQITHAQELLGSKVDHVAAAADATIPLERLAEAIDDETGLVAITLVSFRTGSKTDVKEVIRLAHEVGALVLVDSFQGVGAIPIDVRNLNADFVTGGVLKYLLGSAGLAFLYCRADLLPQITPTATGWFADEDIFKMDIYDYSPSPTARKFETGTPPIPNIYAANAGMDLMHEIGIAATEQHVGRLTDQLIEGLDRIGAKMVTPRDPAKRGPMIAVATTDDQAMVAALKEDRILTSARDGNIRLSFHSYNSEEDIEQVVAGLERHSDMLVR
ncbi:MAG: aminotransferase class V-fold PLP-dependent enzyme [Acidimicrobiia bacterium]|nr:MAG: aminotransferase class V-fold PLP-dependent enzyme [Acidimicrobiia bacterium]